MLLRRGEAAKVRGREAEDAEETKHCAEPGIEREGCGEPLRDPAAEGGKPERRGERDPASRELAATRNSNPRARPSPAPATNP